MKVLSVQFSAVSEPEVPWFTPVHAVKNVAAKSVSDGLPVLHSSLLLRHGPGHVRWWTDPSDGKLAGQRV